MFRKLQNQFVKFQHQTGFATEVWRDHADSLRDFDLELADGFSFPICQSGANIPLALLQSGYSVENTGSIWWTGIHRVTLCLAFFLEVISKHISLGIQLSATCAMRPPTGCCKCAAASNWLPQTCNMVLKFHKQVLKFQWHFYFSVIT